LGQYELYEYKVKKLLEATALGMVPSKAWKGIEEANGGFIIVKPEGEIVTFLIYDRNIFLDYLFNSTIFETPSTHRNPCAKLYSTEDGGIAFKLPLQIRFISQRGK
jgi:type II restriction enzyme